jgi:hypothetical protein
MTDDAQRWDCAQHSCYSCTYCDVCDGYPEQQTSSSSLAAAALLWAMHSPHACTQYNFQNDGLQDPTVSFVSCSQDWICIISLAGHPAAAPC